jgi:hypothetical protein
LAPSEAEPTADVRATHQHQPLPTTFKVMAWSQVWGAAVGTWFAVRLILVALREHAGVLQVLGLLLFIAFYTISGAGALLMIRGRSTGIRLVRLAQIPQFMSFQGQGVLYSLVSGIYVFAYHTSAGTGLNVGILSTFALRWGDVGLPKGGALNLLAVVIFFYLGKKDPFASIERQHYPARPEDQLGAKTDGVQ